MTSRLFVGDTDEPDQRRETHMASAAVERVTEEAREVIRREAEGLAWMSEHLDESFPAVVRVLLDCTGKVFVTGAGTSGAIARRMAHLLAVCGTPSVFLQAADALHGTMGAVAVGDVLVAISKGGSSTEINELVAGVRERGAMVVALTATADSALGRAADLCVVIPTPEGVDPGGVIAMGSTLAVAAWGDALALVLMRVRDYTWEQVLQTHPSGAVGQSESLPEPLPQLHLDGDDGVRPASS